MARFNPSYARTLEQGSVSLTDLLFSTDASTSVVGQIIQGIDNGILITSSLDSLGNPAATGTGFVTLAVDMPFINANVEPLWANIQNKPTTVAGYGITDAYTKTETDSRYVNITGDTMTGNLTIKDAHIGTWVGGAGYAVFQNNNISAANSYALIQDQNGATFFNSAAGQYMRFRINNADQLWFNGSIAKFEVQPFYGSNAIAYETGSHTFGTVTATQFVKSGGTASQFLKADGSVDNSVYLTSSALDGDLLAIAALTGTGILTRTGTNTWTLDTNTYLTTSSAASTYLSIANAASTYLTQSNAASTYLTISNAASTYLTTASAASTYLTIGNASTTYSPLGHTHTFASLTSKPTTISGFGITDAYTSTQVDTLLSSYLTTASASSTYLTIANAASTYLTISSASGTYQPLDGDLTSIAGLSGTTGWLKKTAANTFVLDTTVLTSSGAYYIGTTLNSFGRASGAQTLAGVSIDGNAATATLAANSTLWNGLAIALATYTSGTIASFLGFNSTNNRTEFMTASHMQSFLGLGSAAYTASTAYYAAGSTVVNSTQWNGYTNSFGSVNTTGLGYVVGFDGSTSVQKIYSVAAVQSFLGLGSNAYTSTAYLPLTGGTLTGSLVGTNITANNISVSAITATSSAIFQQNASSVQIKLERTGTSAGSAWIGADDTAFRIYNSALTAQRFSVNLSTGEVTAANFNGSWLGYSVNEGNAASTVAARNSSGDITTRLFRTEYPGDTGTTGNYFLTMNATGAGNDNYGRPMSMSAVKTAMGLGSAAYLNAVQNYSANKVVQYDSNGYIQAYYINSATANNENGTVSQFIITNGTDNYYRKASVSHIQGVLGLGSMAYASTGSYVDLSSSQTITGVKYFASNIGSSNSFITSAGDGGASLQAYSTGNSPAYMSFHRGGNYAINFGLNIDNEVYLGGWSDGNNVFRWRSNGGGDFVTRGALYPGYNNASANAQTSYYIYGYTSGSGIRTTGNFWARDFIASRGDNTGVIYFNDAQDRYLYYNGTDYRFGADGSAGYVRARGYQGHSNVAGTGDASYHPSGIYSTGTNWLYGTIYTNGNNIYLSGGNILTADSSNSGLKNNSGTHWLTVQDASGNTHLRTPSGGQYFDADVNYFRNATGSFSRMELSSSGHLYTYYPMYPGYNNAGGGMQSSYYFYGNTANGGIRTNGNFLASGDIYHGTNGVWLSSLLNQNVRSDASVTFNGIYNNEWFRNNNLLQGLYNQSSNKHFYSGSTYWVVGGNGSTTGGIEFRTTHESTVVGYTYYDTSGFGLLNNQGGWSVRCFQGSSYGGLLNGSWQVAGHLSPSGNVYLDSNYGQSIVGVYSSVRYQGVYAMGDSYKLSADGTSPGTLYGLAWTHSNVGGQSIAGLGHQMLCMVNGVTQSAMGDGIWTRSHIYAGTTIQSVSHLYGGDQVYAGYSSGSGYFRFYGATGLYSQSYGSILQPCLAASHGSWELSGYSKGSYNGLNIISPSGYWNNFMFASDSGGWYKENASNGTFWPMYYYHGHHCLGLMSSATTSGYRIQLNGATYCTSTFTAASGGFNSDMRLKDLVEMDLNSAAIDGLGIISYKWKDEEKDQRTHYGYSAQEVQAVMPNAVYADGNGMLSVAYHEVHTVKIARLEQRVEELEKELKALRA